MSDFRNMKLSDIPVIPGTHHSAVSAPMDGVNPIWGWFECQDLNVFSQLMAGVRFLDVRVSVDLTNELVVSNKFWSDASFSAVLGEISWFLKHQTTECVILYIRAETLYGSIASIGSQISAELNAADLQFVTYDSIDFPLSLFAGKVLLVSDEYTLVPGAVPFLIDKDVFEFRNIGRIRPMSWAKSWIDEYMKARDPIPKNRLGGVALDGTFALQHRRYSSADLNKWFLDNLRGNAEWEHKWSLLGVVIIDFADKETIESLLAFNDDEGSEVSF